MDIRINASFGIMQLLIFVSAVAVRIMNGTTGSNRIPIHRHSHCEWNIFNKHLNRNKLTFKKN